jgi:hypothetical protein
MALGLAGILARGVLGFSQGKRVAATEQRVQEREESDSAARARRQMLEERLLDERLQRPKPTENIDPLSRAGLKARLDYDRQRRRTGRGGASDPTVVDQRAAVRMANDLYENGDEFKDWDSAFEEAQRRLKAAGRLGGGTPVARPDPKRPVEVPPILRNYISGQNRGRAQPADPNAPQPNETAEQYADRVGPKIGGADARRRWRQAHP